MIAYILRASPRPPLCSPLFGPNFPMHKAQLVGGKAQGIDVFDPLTPEVLEPVVAQLRSGLPFSIEADQFSGVDRIRGSQELLRRRLSQQRLVKFNPRRALSQAREAINTSALAFALGYDFVGSYSFKCTSSEFITAQADTLDHYDPLLEGDMFLTSGVMEMLRGDDVALTTLDSAKYYFDSLVTSRDPRTRRPLSSEEQAFYQMEKDLRLISVFHHRGDAYLDHAFQNEKDRPIYYVRALEVWRQAISLLQKNIELTTLPLTLKMLQEEHDMITEKMTLVAELLPH
ncbi:MAG: hypothetical protein ABII18_03425 [bacterium]|nr:hypothetical protein [bacterium]MBU1916846.1 hypothetical protein [bacterium]